MCDNIKIIIIRDTQNNVTRKYLADNIRLFWDYVTQTYIADNNMITTIGTFKCKKISDYSSVNSKNAFV